MVKFVSFCINHHYRISLNKRQNPLVKVSKRNTSNDRYSENIIRDGHRLYLSLDILKHLCVKTKLSLIFEVSIDRQSSTHDTDIPDDVKYPGPYCNLYTLSKDGVIRDYQSRSYQLR